MTQQGEINPYAAPILSTDNRSQTRGSRIEGNCIVVSEWTVLPMRCISTNMPCNTSKKWLLTLSYAPSFRLMLKRRYCRLTYCQANDSFWIRALLAVAIFSSLAIARFSWITAAVIAAIPLLTKFPNRLKVVKYRDGEFWIKGFHNDFLQSLVDEDGWQRV